jgi:hypothetical protein
MMIHSVSAQIKLFFFHAFKNQDPAHLSPVSTRSAESLHSAMIPEDATHQMVDYEV